MSGLCSTLCMCVCVCSAVVFLPAVLTGDVSVEKC